MNEFVEVEMLDPTVRKRRAEGEEGSPATPLVSPEERILALEALVRTLQLEISELTQRVSNLVTKGVPPATGGLPEAHIPHSSKGRSRGGLGREKSGVTNTSQFVRQNFAEQNIPVGGSAPDRGSARNVPGTFQEGIRVSSREFSEEGGGWQEVRRRAPVREPAASRTPAASRSFKDILLGSTPAETLSAVLRVQEPPESRTTGVVTVMAKLPLRTRARAQPLLAWKAALKALKAPEVLRISLLNPCLAELYVDEAQVESLCGVLRRSGYLVSKELSVRDVERRARDYLRGFFRPLRRAALSALAQNLPEAVLAKAEEKLVGLDPHQRKMWRFQLQLDREWLRSHAVGESFLSGAATVGSGVEAAI